MVGGVTQTVPATPIVTLYDELHQRGVSRMDKLGRARAFVAEPGSLAARFAESVARLAEYLPRDEGFYRSRKHYEVSDLKNQSSTAALALAIRDAGGLTPVARARCPAVDGERVAELGLSCPSADSLAAQYLDRELVATRTTGGATHSGTAMRLDLLLAAADRIPIVGEIKRTAESTGRVVPGTDKDPFSALVQALACTAQLATPAQFARLSRWGRAGADERPLSADLARVWPPTFDVYIVLHNRPTGTHLGSLGVATEQLAAELLALPGVARHVRRIACLVTTVADDALLAQLEWAFERPTPPTAALETAFGTHFAPWGIALPTAAALGRLDGSLYARGWTVRWRWRETGLEFRAAHRMTSERWHTIGFDGEIADHPVPPEMMVFGPGDDRDAVEAAHRAKWAAHGAAVDGADMGFVEWDAAEPPSDDRLLWRLDGGQRGAIALPPEMGSQPSLQCPSRRVR
jgi:hypothetical protein